MNKVYNDAMNEIQGSDVGIRKPRHTDIVAEGVSKGSLQRTILKTIQGYTIVP